jgi:hypothetical protein
VKANKGRAAATPEASVAQWLNGYPILLRVNVNEFTVAPMNARRQNPSANDLGDNRPHKLM